MNLSEDTIGIWYVEGSDKNWLLTLFHDDGIIKGTYRFRYYKDDDPFSNNDKKSWYDMICRVSEKEAIEQVRTVALVTSIQFKGPITEIIRGDKSYEDFYAEFINQDFVHMSMVPAK